VHLVGFIIRIYHNVRSHECQTLVTCNLFQGVISKLNGITLTDWLTVNTVFHSVEGSSCGLI